MCQRNNKDCSKMPMPLNLRFHSRKERVIENTISEITLDETVCKLIAIKTCQLKPQNIRNS